MMTCYEHLDLLREQIERHLPELSAHLARRSQILHVSRRGAPERYVVWSHYAGAYEWMGGQDAGAQLGADALQAVEQIKRTLLPTL
ncbi:hypothetical protein [Actinomadura bangladeshensis]|uniref:Uncharacterized protein n=1 Tax=Actinomadura bangladeshensis TaxID=453573 RepID=A0A6L9QAT1_9ACTN|nr:hypothetical protein [Actinomadura bangladeshensis]NEA22607.1 hypothetical protein [Actinomadura bangladeshensis]